MTDSLLPVVTEGVAAAVYREIEESPDDGSYLFVLLMRLEERNPHLAEQIQFAAKHSDNPMEMLRLAVSIYRLLESQAEADRLHALLEM